MRLQIVYGYACTVHLDSTGAQGFSSMGFADRHTRSVAVTGHCGYLVYAVLEVMGGRNKETVESEATFFDRC